MTFELRMLALSVVLDLE